MDINHHYVIRSAKVQPLEGDPPKGGIVIIAFDNLEKAREWYDSPAYASIRPLRQSAAKSRIFIRPVEARNHYPAWT